ncbi:triose-phosphate isomerase [Candidatus Woesearchaeota archaeon]|nr:triose-phosphate isomerase [Candidatus Woesearchaeota archaeon]
MYIINFKAYPESTGKKAVLLAKACERVSIELKKTIVVAVQATDIATVAKAVSIPVFSQHIDQYGAGAHTGYVSANAIIAAGAKGTLLNHSERRLSKKELKASVLEARATGLKVVICAKNTREGVKLSKKYEPNYIAVEPPELIGGDVSVSTATPDLISKSAQKIHSAVLVGAGIKNHDDVRIAHKLGAQGILVASSIVKAKDPYNTLKEMLSNLS